MACVCKVADIVNQAPHQQIGRCRRPCRQQRVPEREMLVSDSLILRPSASALRPSSPMPVQPACTQLDRRFAQLVCVELLVPTAKRNVKRSAVAWGHE
eukprot:5859886-Pleurochrysis_carterae.AAC.1